MRLGVDLRLEHPGAVERLVRQRCEQRRLHGEGFPDRLHTPTDVTVVVFRHRRGDERVEVIEGGQGGDRDKVAAAEPADLTLHPTLLMGAVDPWQQKNESNR